MVNAFSGVTFATDVDLIIGTDTCTVKTGGSNNFCTSANADSIACTAANIPNTCTTTGTNNDCAAAIADAAACTAATTSGGNSDSANACVFVDNSCEFQSQSIVSASASGITNIVVTTAVDHPDFELDTYFSCDVTIKQDFQLTSRIGTLDEEGTQLTTESKDGAIGSGIVTIDPSNPLNTLSGMPWAMVDYSVACCIRSLTIETGAYEELDEPRIERLTSLEEVSDEKPMLFCTLMELRAKFILESVWLYIYNHN